MRDLHILYKITPQKKDTAITTKNNKAHPVRKGLQMDVSDVQIFWKSLNILEQILNPI